MDIKIISPIWDAPASVKSLVTTKALDFGLNSSNKEQSIKELANICNNKFIKETTWLQQEHGIEITELSCNIYLSSFSEYNKGIEQNILLKTSIDNSLPVADAVFTRAKNKICAVLTADCLPILVTNTTGSLACAIHAGWRGLVHGIIENSIYKLSEQPSKLLVYLGPAIGPTKFEVGEDVRQVFIKHAKDKGLVNSSFISLNKTSCSNSSEINLKSSNYTQTNSKQNTKANEEDKYLANIYTLARDRLSSLGVLSQHIFQDNFCTYSQEDLFHSYRRDKTTARMTSMIWLD